MRYSSCSTLTFIIFYYGFFIEVTRAFMLQRRKPSELNLLIRWGLKVYSLKRKLRVQSLSDNFFLLALVNWSLSCLCFVKNLCIKFYNPLKNKIFSKNLKCIRVQSKHIDKKKLQKGIKFHFQQEIFNIFNIAIL